MHWRRKWQPTPVFLPGESQGQRSLVGCHLWSCTQLGMTEVTYHVCMHTDTHTLLPLSSLSFLGFSTNSMSPAYLLLVFILIICLHFSLYSLFCYSPLLLNLLITRLDIEVRILLCFSWLLTLYIRFHNPRRPCNQGALSCTERMGALAT